MVYKYLIVNLVFSQFGFWSGNLVLIAPFPDLCLLVPFYKFKKLIERNDFSFKFRKIITRYRRIGYNLIDMRQSASLVFNPVMVDGYAAFFNCTPVSRMSDSMIAPT